MRVSPISTSYVKFTPNLCGKAHMVRNTALGLALCASSFVPISCYHDEIPVVTGKVTEKTKTYNYNDDYILPDTVNQPIIQDIQNIHERVNTIFQSLGIIEQTKNINDVYSIEFEDSVGNKYKFSNISQTEKGFEFYGIVNHAGAEENVLVKFSDGNPLINRPLVCMETTFNKAHNLSMIYQNQWRKGQDGKPERRIFQNRTNQDVDSIDPHEYYPYDSYNIFALRRTENGISSKALSNKYSHSPDDEIKNIKVVYK